MSQRKDNKPADIKMGAGYRWGIMIATARTALQYQTPTLVSKILVPVDFSERSAAAAGFAIKLAQRFHAKVILLHVERFVGGVIYEIEDERWLKERMTKFLPEYARDPNVWRTIHVNPDVADEIVFTAIGIRADLIVMAMRGHGAIRRALVGSVAAKVLRDAPCPVLASAHASSPRHIEWPCWTRILCKVDSVPESTGVLPWVSKLASELNAELCVAWSKKMKTEMRDEIDELENTYRIRTETVVDAGNAPKVLRGVAEEMGSSLLVVSRNARNATSDCGLDAYQVIREAPCPVMSV